MGTGSSRILLEVHTIGDSLSGRASTPDGQIREFTGWLGLMAALQTLLPGTDSNPLSEDKQR